MRKKNLGTPPSPLKKPILGGQKPKMGRFAQKGLCYSFEILQGLQSNKKIRNPMKKILELEFSNWGLDPPPQLEKKRKT